MPQTLERIFNGQIIGGMFSERRDADRALEVFEDLRVPAQNVQLIRQLNRHHAANLYADILADRGMEEEEAQAYDRAICDGKILVVVYEVADPATILEVFDRLGASVGGPGD